MIGLVKGFSWVGRKSVFLTKDLFKVGFRVLLKIGLRSWG